MKKHAHLAKPSWKERSNFDTIVFDLGDVIIDLNEDQFIESFKNLGWKDSIEAWTEIIHQFEVGKITEDELISAMRKDLRQPVFKREIKAAYNDYLGEIDPAKVKALKSLKSKGKRLILLSNTNAWHIGKIKEKFGPFEWQKFTGLFDQVYLSHEVGMRKPDIQLFEKVSADHALNKDRTLYIDDLLINTETGHQHGWRSWYYQPTENNLTDVLDIIR